MLCSPTFWVLLICLAVGLVGGFNFDKVWGQYTLTSSIAVFSVYINYKIGVISDLFDCEWVHYIFSILIKLALLVVGILGLCIRFKACVLPFGIAIILISIINTIMANEFEYGDDEIDTCIGYICGCIAFLFLTIASSLILPSLAGTIVSIVSAVIGIATTITYQIIFLDDWDDAFIWVGVVYSIIQIVCAIVGAVAI